jgi:hypothetical protein
VVLRGVCVRACFDKPLPCVGEDAEYGRYVLILGENGLLLAARRERKEPFFSTWCVPDDAWVFEDIENVANAIIDAIDLHLEHEDSRLAEFSRLADLEERIRTALKED